MLDVRKGLDYNADTPFTALSLIKGTSDGSRGPEKQNCYEKGMTIPCIKIIMMIFT